MTGKLYVGNLPYGFSSRELRQLFEPFGAVRAVDVVLDRMTGRSRGFGFVELETAEAAQAAIRALHDTEIGGRRLTVNEARERAPGAPGGGDGGGGGFGGPRPAEPRSRGGFGPPRPGNGGFHGGGGFRSGGTAGGGRGGERSRERGDRWDDGAGRGRRGGRSGRSWDGDDEA